MPGYLGTPLSKKLGIKEGFRALLVRAPADVLAELRDALAGCGVLREIRDGVDFAIVFTTSRSELEREFRRVSKELMPAGMLWISWPKKSSSVKTDLDENVVREIGLTGGLVDVKVCAVTDVWSGLKFVRRVKDRNVKGRK